MKLNGIEIKILSYTSETIDDDMIIYNEDSKKIVIFNHSARFIWNEITKGYLNDIDLESIDILNSLINKYNIPNSDIDMVKKDVDDAINLFYQAYLLTNIKR